METVNITITKLPQHILIKNTEGQQIQIFDSNKELKASDIILFLKYSKDKKYVLEPLEEKTKKDKNIISIYEIFYEILEKINPINEE